MKKGICLFLAAALSLAASAAASASGWHRENVEVKVLSDRGSRFHTLPHQDYLSGKTHVLKQYLEARKGENYQVALRNNTAYRIGVVIAVDGRNIISGKKSHLRHNESMYVLNPYEQGVYGGWRTGDNTVHRFYFTDPGDSYAVRTFGDESAMGVIAVSVFQEKGQRPLPGGKQRSLGKRGDNGAPESLAEDRAGTGFGDRTYSPSVKVAFKPEYRPVQKILVKYEWREQLCRMGLLSCRGEGNRLWDDGEGYAPYPPDSLGRLSIE